MGKLSITGVTKAFGALDVLSGVDLDVEDGALVALLGASGSGKTTLLRILAGFERPDRGRIAVDGEVLVGEGIAVPPEDRRIGYVPQDGALFPHLSVAENVAFGLPRAERRHIRRRAPAPNGRIADVLELVGLAGFGARQPHQLSGGQQQRVALARALAPDPRLLLLDEPFSSLDEQLRASVRAEVVDVLRRSGTTSIIVTHDQDEALSVADEVALLSSGQILQVASPQLLYDEPVDPAVAAFVGVANLLPGLIENGRLTTALGTLPYRSLGTAISSGRALVLVRPEQLALVPMREVAVAVAVAHATQVDYHGHDALVHVKVDQVALGSPTGGPSTLVVRLVGDAPPALDVPLRLAVRGEVRLWPVEDGRQGGRR